MKRTVPLFLLSFALGMNLSAQTALHVTNEVAASSSFSTTSMLTAAAEKTYTIVDIKGEHLTDRVLFFTEPGTTYGFDNGWDVKKRTGSTDVPQLYAQEEDGRYQVNTVPDIHDRILSFIPGTDTDYILTFTHSNIESVYETIYLLDLDVQLETDITANGSQYPFTVDSESSRDRFKFITKTIATDIDDATAAGVVKVYGYNKQLHAVNTTGSRGTIGVFDMIGRTVYEGVLAPEGITLLPVELPANTYIVKVQTENDVRFAEKLMIK